MHRKTKTSTTAKPTTKTKRSRRGTTPSTELRAQLLGHLTALRLKLSPEQLDELLARAERERWAAAELLVRTLAELARGRQERAIELRVNAAKFARSCSLETFDWDFNAKVIDRHQIEHLATGDFIHRRDNLLLLGQSGVGKSHLVQAIGASACSAGYRVRYTTSADLLRLLHGSLADGTLPTKLRRLLSPELLIIDEFGFDYVERTDCRQAAGLFYKVIDQRHGRRSTALVSNVDFKAWPDYLGDAPLAMALMDRLVDRAIILKIAGRSYRAHRRKPKSQAK